jgi:hypothetical protein
MEATLISHPARWRTWLLDHPALLTLALLLLVLSPPAAQYGRLVGHRLAAEASTLRELRAQIEHGRNQDAIQTMRDANTIFDHDQAILLGRRPPALRLEWAEAMLAALRIQQPSTASISSTANQAPAVSRALEQFRALQQEPGFQEAGLAGVQALSFYIPPSSGLGKQLTKQLAVYEAKADTPPGSLASPAARYTYFTNLARLYAALGDFEMFGRAVNTARSLRPTSSATVRPLTIRVTIDREVVPDTLTLTSTDNSGASFAIDESVGTVTQPLQFFDDDTPTLVRISWAEPAPNRPRPTPRGFLVYVRANDPAEITLPGLTREPGDQPMAAQNILHVESVSTSAGDTLPRAIQLGIDANSRPILRAACWWGTLYERAAPAQRACDALGGANRLDEAIALALNDGLTGDSVSARQILAIGLGPQDTQGSPTGDTSRRAIAQTWLNQLDAGRNPFESVNFTPLRSGVDPFVLNRVYLPQSSLEP